MPDIVVLGSLNTDQVLRVPALPTAGQTVLGRELRKHHGGKGANQAVAAARYVAATGGGSVVAMVGRVGDDEDGRRTLTDLTANGVDTADVRTDPAEPTGTALILVDDTGENLIAVAPGANGAVGTDDATRAAGRLRAGDIVVCQLEVPLPAVTALATAARPAGARVVCNAAPAVPLPADLLATFDVLVVNESEAQVVLGTVPRDPAQAAAAAARAGCAVVVTHGPDGAVHAGPDGRSGHCPAPAVTAVDTVGAGDAFVGAFAVALARQADLADATRAGVAAGSHAVTRPGARTTPPPRPAPPVAGSAATSDRQAR